MRGDVVHNSCVAYDCILTCYCPCLTVGSVTETLDTAASVWWGGSCEGGGGEVVYSRILEVGWRSPLTFLNEGNYPVQLCEKRAL